MKIFVAVNPPVTLIAESIPEAIELLLDAEDDLNSQKIEQIVKLITESTVFKLDSIESNNISEVLYRGSRTNDK